MKENFFTSMLSEGGKISHKRWIAVTIAAVLCWAIIYATVKAITASERLSIILATMAFILIMSGVTTAPQLLSIWRGTPPPKEEEQKDKP